MFVCFVWCGACFVHNYDACRCFTLAVCSPSLCWFGGAVYFRLFIAFGFIYQAKFLPSCGCRGGTVCVCPFQGTDFTCLKCHLVDVMGFGPTVYTLHVTVLPNLRVAPQVDWPCYFLLQIVNSTAKDFYFGLILCFIVVWCCACVLYTMWPCLAVLCWDQFLFTLENPYFHDSIMWIIRCCPMVIF